MKISELGSAMGFECLHDAWDDRPLAGGYASDLLSDVMSRAGDDDVLVTIQAHKNTVAVASLVGMAAVVLCNARPVPDDMLEAAKAERIALFRTGKTQFEVSGLLYAALRGGAPGPGR